MSDARMTIRNIDLAIYRRARIVALENEIPMGELINHSLEFFMNEAVLVEIDAQATDGRGLDVAHHADGCSESA